MITQKRLIASIVSFSMLFSLIGPNMVLASETNEDSTVVIETSVPEEEQTDVTLSPEEQDPEEPAESKEETEAPKEETSEPTTEETADPSDVTSEETEDTSDTEETTQPQEVVPEETEETTSETTPETIPETTPEETEAPKRGMAKGPTRGGATATAGSDAYALLYDDGTLVFQQGDTPDASKTLVATYEVNTTTESTGDYARLWLENASDITTVVFNDRLVGVTNFTSFFQGCSNLTSIENISYIDTSSATYLTNMFWNCSSLTSLDLSSFNTSNVESFACLINGCSSLTSIDMSNWDLSSITSLGAFGGFGSGANSLTTVNCSYWTNLPSTLSHGFARTMSITAPLTTLNCTGWVFPAGASVEGLFGNVKATNIIVNGWDVSGLTNTGFMFQNVQTSDLDLSALNFANVTDASSMFDGMQAHDIKVSLPSGISYTAMFARSKLHTLDLSDTDIDSIAPTTNVNGLFSNMTVTNLILSQNTTIENIQMTGLSGKWYNTTAEEPSDFENNAGGTHQKMYLVSQLVLNGGEADYNEIYAYNANYIDPLPTPTRDNYNFIGWFDADGNEITESAFEMPEDVYAKWEYIPQTATVGTDAYVIVYNDYSAVFQKGNEPDPEKGTALATVQITNSNYRQRWWISDYNDDILSVDFRDNIVGLTNATNFFGGMSKVTQFTNLDRLDMSQVTNMSNMFQQVTKCAIFEGWNAWDLSNVTNAAGVFHAGGSGANHYGGFANVDIKWNMPKVTNLSEFAYGQQDLSFAEGSYIRANTGTLTNISKLCYYCQGVTSLDVFDLNTSNVTDMSSAFYNCSSLVDISALSSWDVSKVTTLAQLFYLCRELDDISALATWTPTSVTNISNIFYRAESLADISPLANWTTGQLTTASYAFYDIPIEEADISGFNITSSTNTDYIFRNYDGYQIKKITIGENCVIGSNYIDDSGLAGNWFNGTDRYTDTELFVNNTSDKANTYYRTFTFTFYPMGGTCSPTTAECSVIGFVDPNFVLPTPTKSGYSFTRWYDDNGRTFTSYPVGEELSCAYAEYEFETGYTLILKSNLPGVEDVSVELEIPETYRLDPTMFGEFADKRINAWTTKIDGTGTTYGAQSAVSNLGEAGDVMTLYAQWTDIVDRLHFMHSGQILWISMLLFTILVLLTDMKCTLLQNMTFILATTLML